MTPNDIEEDLKYLGWRLGWRDAVMGIYDVLSFTFPTKASLFVVDGYNQAQTAYREW